LDKLPGVESILNTHQSESRPEDRYFLIEFLLWGLEAHKKLNKYRTLEGFQFKDTLGSYISRL
jgi:magnesium chelatase subunit I